MSAPCPALGFIVDLMPRASVPAEAMAQLRAEWAAFLDERGLRSTERVGGGRIRFEVESEASQATQNDRDAAQFWLAARPELDGCHVGDIRDLRPDT